MRTTKLPKCPCPFCGAQTDAATSASDPRWKPEPGDVSVCLECVNIVVFTERLSLRKPTDTEMIEMAGDHGVRQTVFAAASFKAYRDVRDDDMGKMLNAIVELGGQVRAHALADHLGWDSATTYGVFRACQERGLVKERPS